MNKVLLVDDVAENLVVTKDLLDDLIPDCHVFTAQSGKEGLKIASEEQPDTIITDIIMPEMDGYEFCRKLNADSATANIPIMILTGSKVDAEWRVKCLDAGADVFLSKPVDASELTAQVKVLLRCKKAEDKLRAEKVKLEEKVKERTQELKESEEALMTVLENIPFAVFAHNLDGKFTIVNQTSSKYTGYTKDELLSMTVKDIDNESITRNDRKLIWEELKNSGYKEIVSNHCRKDGSIYPAEIYFTAITIKNEPLILGVAKDITERKKAEKDLDRIFNLSPDMICISGFDGYARRLNPAFEKTLGYTNEEILARPFLDFVHPEDRAKTIEKLQELVEGTSTVYFEQRCRCKDGSYKWLAWANAPVVEEGLMFAVAHDITERKEAETELKKSEEKYKLLVNNIHEGLMQVDNDDRIFYVNDKICEIFGFTREELIGKIGYKTLIFEEDREIIKQKNITRGKNLYDRYEIRGRKKSGEIIWLSISGTALKDIEGKVIGTVGLLSDITDRKQAEKELRESEERFRGLYENSTIGLYRTTPEGNILFANPTCVKMLGYSSFEELVKRDLNKEGFQSDYPRKNFKRLMDEKGEVRGLESGWRRKDGKAIYARESAKVFHDENGNILYYEGTLEDITERKKAEEIQKTIYNISNAMSAVDNMQDLYIKIKEFLGDVIDTNNFYIALYDEKTDIISFAYYADETFNRKDYLPASRKFGNGLTEYVIKTGKPLFATEDVVNKLLKKGLIESIGSPSEIWLGVPLKFENKVIGVIAVQSYHDPNLYTEKDIEILNFISEEIALAIDRKKAEEELKINRERLRIANSILRHDITNDIVVIKSALDIYRDENDVTMLDEIDKRIEKSINTIKKQREQEKFLDSHLALVEYKIEKVVNKVIKDYSDIEINVTGTGKVYADNAIYSVFENIMNNAILHGKTKKIDIEINSDEEYCVIKIADYGIGIPDEYKYDIFEEGFKYGPHGHTGIGLYIVQKTIEDYGGTIFVEDNKPNGAVFVIRLRKVIKK